MIDVVIDGVKYTPLESQTDSYGVAVSTHQRHNVLAVTLPKIIANTPSHVPIVVTCDHQDTYGRVRRDWASKSPRITILKTNPGVYASKNAGLDYLMRKTSVQHIFLLDDDIYPVSEELWQAYIDAPEPHYAHSFDLPEVYRDRQVVATTRSGGTLLYVERPVVEVVGGMSRDFGTWGCEHVNWSDRIHNLGFTTYRYQDVPAVYDGELAVEFDRKDNLELAPRGFAGVKTRQQVEHNRAVFEEYEARRAVDVRFVDFRSREYARRHVFTVFMSGVDPQGGGECFDAAPACLDALVESLKGSGFVLHVLSNVDFTGWKQPGFVQIVHTELYSDTLPIDYQRWWLLRNYLAEDFLQKHGSLHGLEAWHVDATDVQLLPTKPLLDVADRLYIGYESTTVGCNWLREQTDTLPAAYREWWTKHQNKTLVNAGVLGGDAALLKLFLDHLCRELGETYYWGQPAKVRDMVPIQKAVHTWNSTHPCPIEHGPRVTSVFKSNGQHGKETAQWQHK